MGHPGRSGQRVRTVLRDTSRVFFAAVISDQSHLVTFTGLILFQTKLHKKTDLAELLLVKFVSIFIQIIISVIFFCKHFKMHNAQEYGFMLWA